MLRSLTAIGFVLALVGTAHAESAVTIKVAGKSSHQIRAELYKAAKQVCNSEVVLTPNDIYSNDECVQLTYHNGLEQLNGHAAAQPVSYVAQGASSVLARP